jgi:hypothetical protein
MSYDCRKLVRFAESDFWADWTFWNKASPISEGVAEIRINSHLARENNLTTQYT